MKQTLFALLHFAGIFRFYAWLNRRHVPIISYHSVLASSDPRPFDPHKQHIPLPLFQAHLDYLSRNHNVVSLSEFIQAKSAGRQLPDYTVVLTFEDGMLDFHSVAAPQLERRGFPATVFVITDFANGQEHPSGESYLSWDEILDLSERGFDVGSHTRSHPNLTEISLDDVSEQLASSLAIIQQRLNHNHIPLSYPYGYTSDAICRLAQGAGYYCAIGDTIVGNVNPDSDLFVLNRVTIASDDDVHAFAARVSGFAAWARRIFRNERARALTSRPASYGYPAKETETCSPEQVISS